MDKPPKPVLMMPYPEQEMPEPFVPAPHFPRLHKGHVAAEPSEAKSDRILTRVLLFLGGMWFGAVVTVVVVLLFASAFEIDPKRGESRGYRSPVSVPVTMPGVDVGRAGEPFDGEELRVK